LSKQKYIEILFPNGKKKRFNLYDDYETKLKNINKLLKIWHDYIENNWDKELIIAGQQMKPVSNMLDRLTYYLLYDSKGGLTKKGIINNEKQQSINKIENVVSECGIDIQDYFYSSNTENNSPKQYKTELNSNIKNNTPHDKKYNKFKHLKHIDTSFINFIRFVLVKDVNDNLIILKQLDKHVVLAIPKKYYNEKYANVVANEILMKWYKLKKELNIKPYNIKEKNKLLHYAKKAYMNTFTTFEKIELFKKYNIDTTLPYYVSWETVDMNGRFKFNNSYYKINNYNYDKVLIYQQNDKIWFLDADIKLIKNIIKE